MSFAFPEPSLAPLAWVAIAPLLLLARGSLSHGFRIGLAFGLGFFGALLIWISVVGWIAWLLLVVMEALFFGLFGAAWAHVSRVDRRTWLLTAPALWVTTETLRSSVPVVGFPWGELAQSQGPVPWLLQIAQLGGGKTVSFLIVAINVLLAWAWRDRGATRVRDVAVAAMVVAAVAPISHLLPRIDGAARDAADHVVRVAIIQGNASPGVRIENETARVQRHLELTEAVAELDPDLVVWPESSVGNDPFVDPEIGAMVAQAARAADAPMIVGANLDAPEDRYLVTALLVSSTGEFVDRYQKRHLVPFGEYVPWRSGLDWIPMLDQVPRDAVVGSVAKNFTVPVRDAGDESDQTYEVGTVISFEGDFSNLVREHVALGAQLLVVATNTSTWERTWASAQHVAMSQVRAAETRVPVAHAALSGISAAIGPDGVVRETTPLYEEATLVYDITTSSDVSIYARTGEWLPILCMIISVTAIVIAYRRRSTVPR
ncbi:MAG: apolipoprotein N-acyltransferase [Actinomycetota bacterium]|nr:apolipoprotein N-acyltransferase [Actinomycetota bacterium]